jgi:hypothetical protein
MNCKTCNKELIKHKRDSYSTFENKKFCSIACYWISKNKQVCFNCDYCWCESFTKNSAYKRKLNHFCKQSCYDLYKKNILTYDKQPAYKWVRKNWESKQVYHKRYVDKNREYVNDLKLRHYSRKKWAEWNHTLKQREEIKVIYNNKCIWCWESKKLTKDHIIPLSKWWSNYISNIQPLCRNCNSKKNNKLDYIYQNPELLSE